MFNTESAHQNLCCGYWEFGRALALLNTPLNYFFFLLKKLDLYSFYSIKKSIPFSTLVLLVYIVTLLGDINTRYTRFYQTEKKHVGLEWNVRVRVRNAGTYEILNVYNTHTHNMILISWYLYHQLLVNIIIIITNK